MASSPPPNGSSGSSSGNNTNPRYSQQQQQQYYGSSQQQQQPHMYPVAAAGQQSEYRHSQQYPSSSSSSGSGGSSGDHALPPGAAAAGGAAAGGASLPTSRSNPLLLSPNRRDSSYSYMHQAGNTVGLDTTSAAIARGEVGANYSRYSTGNIAALAGGAAAGGPGSNSPGSVNNRLSMMSGHGGAPRASSSLGQHGTEELRDIEMDHLQGPAAAYGAGGVGGAAAALAALSGPAPLNSPMHAPYSRSRFSEYGLGDGASSAESPSLRDSTLYDNGRRESLYYQSGASKSMEDTSLLWNEKNVEADDFLHDPRTLQTAKSDRWWNFPTSGRGLANAIGISVLLGGFLALFMGWPIHVYVTTRPNGRLAGWNMGGTNASGQVPDIPNLPVLIDKDTPAEIRNGIRTGYDGNEYQLVFSDEFNEDGRTFYPGDDPFWEAVDIHYWQTRDLEWYDPDVPRTRNGNLEIELTQQPINNLFFRSGMVQGWNKLCFNKGAFIEVRASLPGNSRASGYWPGIWTMGNLGRAGYGATNDGMWPYSYDTCDVGTLYKQKFANNTPSAAVTTGPTDYSGELSYLAGQRASACTCRNEPHPGPNNKVGRGAPEIDILEAQVDWRGYGTASQSIQIAPFDAGYNWDNYTTDGMELYNSSISLLNSWKGAPTQEAASVVTRYEDCYGGERYETFAYEYTSGGAKESQITWSIGDIPTWTLKAGAFPPRPEDVQVGQRLISEEPMYVILNLAISPSFQSLQFDRLEFPSTFFIDYVRVWQKKGETDVTCDPESHPTADYINQYMEYYTNPNITTWPESEWPKNALIDNCRQ